MGKLRELLLETSGQELSVAIADKVAEAASRAFYIELHEQLDSHVMKPGVLAAEAYELKRRVHELVKNSVLDLVGTSGTDSTSNPADE